MKGSALLSRFARFQLGFFQTGMSEQNVTKRTSWPEWISLLQAEPYGNTWNTLCQSEMSKLCAETSSLFEYNRASLKGFSLNLVWYSMETRHVVDTH